MIEMECDMQVPIILPKLFPSISSLEWGLKDGHGMRHGQLRGSIYAQTLAQWKDIESLVDFSNYLEIATHLVGYNLCSNLANL
jgi:hypothetical protein